MGKFVTVIDYGLGNLRSVGKALESCGAEVKISAKIRDIRAASAIVLPGVGAFKRAMSNLARLKLTAAVRKAVKEGKPFLGICLGLQILFSESEEHGRCKGLDIIKGRVKRFTPGVKIPHMGWNQLKLKPQNADIFDGIPDNSYFYFVHSYYVEPADKKTAIAVTDYRRNFVSAVKQDNVWGLQFHPEKSAELGLKILKNFLRNGQC